MAEVATLGSDSATIVYAGPRFYIDHARLLFGLSGILVFTKRRLRGSSYCCIDSLFLAKWATQSLATAARQSSHHVCPGSEYYC